jgi:hypothetical protein
MAQKGHLQAPFREQIGGQRDMTATVADDPDTASVRPVRHQQCLGQLDHLVR